MLVSKVVHATHRMFTYKSDPETRLDIFVFFNFKVFQIAQHLLIFVLNKITHNRMLQELQQYISEGLKKKNMRVSYCFEPKVWYLLEDLVPFLVVWFPELIIFLLNFYDLFGSLITEVLNINVLSSRFAQVVLHWSQR